MFPFAFAPPGSVGVEGDSPDEGLMPHRYTYAFRAETV
jgi:hypothetical protein